MRRAVNIFLDIFLGLLILVWVYFLYQEYSRLPVSENSAALQFSIRLLLFSLFLIVSIVAVFTLSFMEKTKSHRPGDPGQLQHLAEKIERLELAVRSGEEPKASGAGSSSMPPIGEFQVSPANMEVWIARFGAVLKARRVSLYLSDSGKELELSAALKTGGMQYAQKIPVTDSEESLAVRSFLSGRRIFATNIETHPEIGRANLARYRNKSFCILPMTVWPGMTVGVLCVSEKDGGPFTVDELEWAEGTLHTVTMEIENRVLRRALEERSDQV